MRKIILSISFILLLTVCPSGPKPKDHGTPVYIVILNNLIGQDTALNKQMEFIAIAMSNFKDLNNEGKAEV